MEFERTINQLHKSLAKSRQESGQQFVVGEVSFFPRLALEKAEYLWSVGANSLESVEHLLNSFEVYRHAINGGEGLVPHVETKNGYEWLTPVDFNWDDAEEIEKRAEKIRAESKGKFILNASADQITFGVKDLSEVGFVQDDNEWQSRQIATCVLPLTLLREQAIRSGEKDSIYDSVSDYLALISGKRMSENLERMSVNSPTFR